MSRLHLQGDLVLLRGIVCLVIGLVLAIYGRPTSVPDARPARQARSGKPGYCQRLLAEVAAERQVESLVVRLVQAAAIRSGGDVQSSSAAARMSLTRSWLSESDRSMKL